VADTPLRKQLNKLVLIFSALAIVVGVFVLLMTRFVMRYSWMSCMQFGIGVVTANVPEGLLGCITVALSITAKQLYKR
jgi:magnesium-transporting ATPase (P-type)